MKPMQKILLPLFFLPVALAHYYNLDLTPVTLLCAFASVALLLISTTVMLGRMERGALRTGVGLVTIYLFTFYYASQFISYYLQGSYFNQQYFFHFNLSTLVETRGVYYPLIFAVLLWTMLVLTGFYYFRDRLPHSTLSMPALLSMLLLALVLDPGVRPAAVSLASSAISPNFDSLDAIDWEALSLEEEAVYNSPPSARAGKNLVLIFLEGLEAIYTDDEVFPGLTPSLHRLNDEGWQLENMEQVQGSSWTMGGIVSSLCGTPLIYESRLTGNEVLFSRLLDSAICLPDILESAGYEQLFMGGASLEFASKGNFLLDHGFDNALGSHELTDELDDPDYIGGWGLYDDTLLALAIDRFDELAAGDRPFNLTLLTVDTHHPTGEPSASCPKYAAIDNSILHAVHCTDFLVGKFIDQIRRSPAYEDTIVVLSSDHLSMRNIAFPLFPDDYDRKLYFNVLNADVRPPEQIPATPLDVSPTLLDLLQVDHDTAFLAGINLLDTPAEALERDIDDRSRVNAIRYINSNHFSTKMGTAVYSLNRASLPQFEFSSGIANPDYVAGSLVFEATNEDPYFFLPALPDLDFDDAMLYLTLDTTEDLNVALYYEDELGAGYSEENRLDRFINPGVNRITFDLQVVASGSRLRIDPGNRPGPYTIREIEIRTE